MSPSPARPVGVVTRGTTNPNRLRRIDRFLVGPLASVLASEPDPLVVDLGYGASPVTTLELARRLRAVRADVRVIGAEIDPDRVTTAVRALERLPPARRGGVEFVRAGFEMGGPALGGHRPVLVRAANVLRQYDESEVAQAWGLMASRLAPGGVIVDATCDELGRLCSWVVVGPDAQPRSLTVSMRLAGLDRPGVVAERLPKALIHRNVAGEWVHDWLSAIDDAWARTAGHAGFGARQRFCATAQALRDAGWPLLDGPARWRLGELTRAWPVE